MGRLCNAAIATFGLTCGVLAVAGCATRGERRFPALPDAAPADARVTEFEPDGGGVPTPDAAP